MVFFFFSGNLILFWIACGYMRLWKNNMDVKLKSDLQTGVWKV